MANFHQLLLAVREVAQDYPDRTTDYESKSYWDWTLDRPGDIVGTALHRFGVRVPVEWNSRSVNSLDWRQLGFGRMPFGPPMKWLSVVQHRADMGMPWRDAVAAADEVVPFYPRRKAA